MNDLDKIRNFSIIAHIDHGKSTLADRLIQHCGGLTEREMTEQVLDNMDIERERGITIKAQTVRLKYTAKNGETYALNLMDTPGHVDFAYEVSRSLAACEGALLVVDAAQGVEAQTLANVYQSIEHDHEILPVINKIDLPAAEPERVKEEIEEVIGIPADDAVLASAKSGIGIEDILEQIVTKIPAPTGDRDAPLKAMLVDSWYDPYLGVIILVRVIDGVIKKGLQVKFMQQGTVNLIDRVGCMRPKIDYLDELAISALSLRKLKKSRKRQWVTPSPPRKMARPSHCRALKKCNRWFFADYSRLMLLILRNCANPSVNCGSMMPVSPMKWRPARRLALVSVVVFWDCCIWKLFRNGSAANMIWI